MFQSMFYQFKEMLERNRDNKKFHDKMREINKILENEKRDRRTELYKEREKNLREESLVRQELRQLRHANIKPREGKKQMERSPPPKVVQKKEDQKH